MSALNNLSLETCSIVSLITMILGGFFVIAFSMLTSSMLTNKDSRAADTEKRAGFLCFAIGIIFMIVCCVFLCMYNATTVEYSEIMSIESSLDENAGMTYTITLENGNKYTITDYKVVEDKTSEISYAKVETHTHTHEDGAWAIKGITLYLPSNEYYDFVDES